MKVLLYVSTMVVISMAIIIPSKNIYEKNHNKIRDNVIDNIEIDGTEVVPDNHYEEVLHTEKIEYLNNIEDELQVKQELVPEKLNYTGETLYRNKYRYVDLSTAHIINHKFQIEKLKDNSYISKVLSGTNKEGYANIKCSVYYKYSEYPLSGTVSYTVDTGGNSGTINSIIIERSGENTLSESGIGSIPTTFSHEFTYPAGFGLSATLKLNAVDKSNLISDDVYTEDEDYFYFDLSFLTKATFRYVSCFDQVGSTGTFTRTVTGQAVHYEPYRVEITIYGNTIGIDLVDKTVKIGSGSHPFSIGGNNELLQTSNYLNTVDYKAIDTDYDKTLTEYSNGKETATLLCSISDYYDESDNKVIAIDNSTNKMCFRMYDVVEPYVFGANGQDKPLSRNKDGSPKQFQVLGVKPIYDGAVWQELTIQEV